MEWCHDRQPDRVVIKQEPGLVPAEQLAREGEEPVVAAATTAAPAEQPAREGEEHLPSDLAAAAAGGSSHTDTPRRAGAGGVSYLSLPMDTVLVRQGPLGPAAAAAVCVKAEAAAGKLGSGAPQIDAWLAQHGFHGLAQRCAHGVPAAALSVGSQHCS